MKIKDLQDLDQKNVQMTLRESGIQIENDFDREKKEFFKSSPNLNKNRKIVESHKNSMDGLSSFGGQNADKLPSELASEPYLMNYEAKPKRTTTKKAASIRPSNYQRMASFGVDQRSFARETQYLR